MPTTVSASAEWRDDFNYNSLDQSVAAGWNFGGEGTAQVQNGELILHDKTVSRTWQIPNTYDWSVETRWRRIDYKPFGVVALTVFLQDGTRYYLSMDTHMTGGYVVCLATILGHAGTSAQFVAKLDVSEPTVGSWHTFRLEKNGASFTPYYDGVMIGGYTDTNATHDGLNTIAIGTWTFPTISFDYVVVEYGGATAAQTTKTTSADISAGSKLSAGIVSGILAEIFGRSIVGSVGLRLLPGLAKGSAGAFFIPVFVSSLVSSVVDIALQDSVPDYDARFLISTGAGVLVTAAIVGGIALTAPISLPYLAGIAIFWAVSTASSYFLGKLGQTPISYPTPLSTPTPTPIPTSTLTIDDFVGNWVNIDPNTPGIIKIQVSKSGNNLNVHAWGNCHPTYCDWGIVSAYYDGQPFVVVYNPGFAIKTLTMTIEGGALHVNCFTHFIDNSGRQDYGADYYFKKLGD